ncbi:MAG: MliC family protein [Mesorhizobium sp.]
MLRFDPEWLTAIVMLAAVSGCSTTNGPEPVLGLNSSTPVEMGSADDQGGAVDYEDNAASAGRFAWRCDNGETMRIDNVVTSVTIEMPGGEVLDLPASPADSRTRYVFQQYAFVVDGSDALFFRPKATPLNCKRGQASAAPIARQASIDLSAEASRPIR